MVILQDSREQLPLDFNHDFITKVEVMALPVGDYGCRYVNKYLNYICPVIFERKSIGDLFGTLSQGYERFKREIEKAKALDIKLILIVEGSFSKVLQGYDRSERSGISIIKQLFTIWIRYGLVPIFAKDREEASKIITEYYLAIGRNLDFKKLGYIDETKKK